MKTFFRVKLLLLPMAVFWVLAERYPAWAAPVAFLLALAVLGTQVVRGDARLSEKTEVPLLGVLAFASACHLNWITAEDQLGKVAAERIDSVALEKQPGHYRSYDTPRSSKRRRKHPGRQELPAELPIGANRSLFPSH